MSRADVAKVAGVGFGVAGITDSVKPVTTWPGSIWEKDIFIHEKEGLNKACTSCHAVWPQKESLKGVLKLADCYTINRTHLDPSGMQEDPESESESAAASTRPGGFSITLPVNPPTTLKYIIGT